MNRAAKAAKVVIDVGGKASQWSFVLSSSFVNNKTLERLSKLPLTDDFVYVTFAVNYDNTGNHFIEGFVRTSVRRRVSFLKRKIGPAMFSVARLVPDALVAIQTKAVYSEYGDSSSFLFHGLVRDISALRLEILNGWMSRRQLMETFPRLFSNPMWTEHVTGLLQIPRDEDFVKYANQDEDRKKQDLIRQHEEGFKKQ